MSTQKFPNGNTVFELFQLIADSHSETSVDEKKDFALPNLTAIHTSAVC